MFGSSIGQLNIYLVFLDGGREMLWKRSGNQNKTWHHGSFSFTPFSSFKVEYFIAILPQFRAWF
jgi:hypothetical protein